MLSFQELKHNTEIFSPYSYLPVCKKNLQMLLWAGMSLFSAGLVEEALGQNASSSPAGAVAEEGVMSPFVPLYHGAVSSAESIATALQGTYADRTGFSLEKRGSKERGIMAPFLWARYIGQTEDNYYTFGSTDSRASKNQHFFFGLQGGFNLIQAESALGLTQLGVSVMYGRHEDDVKASLNNTDRSLTAAPLGEINLQALGGTAHLTHIFNKAFYTDLSVGGLSYWGKAKDEGKLLDVPLTGTGWLASAELGYRIAIGSSFSVTPQIQISHFKGYLDKVTEDAGAKKPHAVDFGDISNTRLRVGALASFLSESIRGSQFGAYVSLDYLHDFEQKHTLTLDKIPLTFQGMSPNRMQIGGGVSLKIYENLSLFVNVKYLWNVSISESAGVKAIVNNENAKKIEGYPNNSSCRGYSEPSPYSSPTLNPTSSSQWGAYRSCRPTESSGRENVFSWGIGVVYSF